MEGIWTDLSHQIGNPDGGFMVNDEYFYFAFWGASKIVKFNIKGDYLDDLTLPVKNPTNCKRFDDEMIITTALDPEYPDTKRCNMSDGKLFTADLF